MPGPLAGIRIIEMGQLIAIPFSMKMLADMGAQVIRLESTGRLESYRSDSVYKMTSPVSFGIREPIFTSKIATSLA